MTCYRIVLAEKARTPVCEACELLGVSTSGFYAWASRARCDRALSDAWLVEKIKAVHAENRGVYGSRRVLAELRLGEGGVISRKRVQRLMRAAGRLSSGSSCRWRSVRKPATPASPSRWAPRAALTTLIRECWLSVPSGGFDSCLRLGPAARTHAGALALICRLGRRCRERTDRSGGS